MNLKSIDWRFIVVNTLAAILMILGARQLFILLYGSRLLEGLYLYGTDSEELNAFLFQGADGSFIELFYNYNLGRALAGLLGCISSIVVSYLVAKRQNISKINILVILITGLIVAVMVSRINFDFHHIIPSLREVIGWIGIRTVFAVNFIFLLSSALLLHLNKNLKKYFYQSSRRPRQC